MEPDATFLALVENLGQRVNRRGFLGSILLAGVAPAIVRADSLMRIVPIETLVEQVDVTDLVIASRMPGNSLLSIDMITREALKIAHEKFAFLKELNAETDRAYDIYRDETLFRTNINVLGKAPRRIKLPGVT